MHEEISNELMQKNSQWRKSILNEFIHTSKTDLESCVILYDKQLYQQAIFSFQQSIEKAIKVYWLLLNPMTTEKELKQQIEQKQHEIDSLRQLKKAVWEL